MGQQYSEMKCPSATAIFGLGAESMKVGLAKRCCCGGCPREKKKGWHCFTKGAAAVDALAVGHCESAALFYRGGVWPESVLLHLLEGACCTLLPT